jgi:hypothetical protein
LLKPRKPHSLSNRDARLWIFNIKRDIPQGRHDAAPLGPTLEEAEKNLSAMGLAPTPKDPCDLVADKGYYSRDVLKDLDDSPWKTRIAEPRPSKGYLRWHGDDEARAAVYPADQMPDRAR